MMTLELVVGLVGISLVYAFIYANAPKENTWFRLFFLFVSIFTVIPLTWVLFNGQQIETVIGYNVTDGSVLTREVHNITTLGETRGVMLSYFSISIYVPIMVLAIVMIFFLYNIFMQLKSDHDTMKGL